MLVRTQLSSLDFIAGVHLPQAKTKGSKFRYKIVFPKQTNDWVPKPISQNKDGTFLKIFVDRVVKVHHNKEMLPNPRIPNIPKNVATKKAPPKEEIINE